jgi:hypothetical protein
MNRRKKFRSAGNKGFFPLAKNPLSIVHYGPAAGKGLSPHFAKNNDPSDPSSPNNDGEYLLANNPPPPRNSPRWELYKPGETINFS